MNEVQFEKLSGYFIDLAKVWFASGVIGFFVVDYSSKAPAEIMLMSLVASLLFLTVGLKILNLGHN